MTKILSIETTMQFCSVCLFKKNKIFFEEVKSNKEHIQKILPLVKTCLRRSQSQLKEIDLLACTEGPGGFSNTRISVGTTQAMAIAINVPIASFSSSMVIAQGLYRCLGSKRVVVCLKINQNRVNFSSFQLQKKRWIEIIDNQTLFLKNVLSKINQLRDWTIFWMECRSKNLESSIHPNFSIFFKNKKISIKENQKVSLFPNAIDLAILANQAWEDGNIRLVEELCPVYFKEF
ncbi:tRNA (adenosine(37)-N6)-threonylcarbamoyltransferase complex dimerization subunit type 1 TsaB [Candidatus Riesia pediculicola]|uniref:tRNA (adenosine(37)-N6)-threonylcarbamoyltransferase complex dimerization subunit type 1 TsaB n=1 Tax=Candidatus Riesia pediculicola TaxID=401619 RepID=UPI0009C20FA8|nr:tRNA (adenosine(37)-N6)-threonylcarbamoyltransferase complex dimerization subunit type 1 TsaB [Candidatus Riesia pediculicola]ARC54212.1 hypothetical protein AOE57_01180 [Candidatus Riesia pediculicola]